jgi:hypothetical protein
MSRDFSQYNFTFRVNFKGIKCSTDNDRLEKLQLEAARIVTGLTVYSSRESLYQETGWETLSSKLSRDFSQYNFTLNVKFKGIKCSGISGVVV